MRSLSAKAASVVALVGMTTLVAAQPPGGKQPGYDTAVLKGMEYLARQQGPKAKSKLEQALAEALTNNPDLKVAVARAAVAEAELARTRLQVTQKVVTAQSAVESAESELQVANKALAKVKAWAAERPGRRDEELLAAQNTAVQAKTKLAAAQAELDYLVGKSPAKKTAATFAELQSLYLSRGLLAQQAWLHQAGRPAPAGSVSDNVRKALDRKMTVKVDKTACSAVLEQVRKEAPGLHIQMASSSKGAWGTTTISANLADVPLGAVLQLLEDATEHRFVVRDYGLLVVPQDKVPPGAVTLDQFLKSSGKSPEKKTEAKAKK